MSDETNTTVTIEENPERRTPIPTTISCQAVIANAIANKRGTRENTSEI